MRNEKERRDSRVTHCSRHCRFTGKYLAYDFIGMQVRSVVTGTER